MSSPSRAGGRRRDVVLDERILASAREQLAERGYAGMSIGGVARSAGTTRPSVYLRFAGKEDLATAAIAGMSVDEPLRVSDDLHADLVAELRHFRTAVTRRGGMSFVGTVLAEEHHTPTLIQRFRERLVRPRRRRLTGALRRGMQTGALQPDLDVDVLTTMLIGAIYARYLASGDVPATWPERIVTALWPAIGSDHG